MLIWHGGRLKQRSKDFNRRSFTSSTNGEQAIYSPLPLQLHFLPTPTTTNNINKSFKDFIEFAD
jgi:hypothetical protein